MPIIQRVGWGAIRASEIYICFVEDRAEAEAMVSTGAGIAG